MSFNKESPEHPGSTILSHHLVCGEPYCPRVADPLTNRVVCRCYQTSTTQSHLTMPPNFSAALFHTPLHGDIPSPVSSPMRKFENHPNPALRWDNPGLSSMGFGSPFPTLSPAHHNIDNILRSQMYSYMHSGMDPNNGRRKNATRETTAALKAWLKEHKKNPYPTKAEKIMLAIITRMTLTQVSTWFANARRRLKKEHKGEFSSDISFDNISMSSDDEESTKPEPMCTSERNFNDNDHYKNESDMKNISKSDRIIDWSPTVPFDNGSDDEQMSQENVDVALEKYLRCLLVFFILRIVTSVVHLRRFFSEIQIRMTGRIFMDGDGLIEYCDNGINGQIRSNMVTNVYGWKKNELCSRFDDNYNIDCPSLSIHIRPDLHVIYTNTDNYNLHTFSDEYSDAVYSLMNGLLTMRCLIVLFREIIANAVMSTFVLIPVFQMDQLLRSQVNDFWNFQQLSNQVNGNDIPATKQSSRVLKTWLREHRKNPYPTKTEKVMLAFSTRMTMTQISNWFANARRRMKQQKDKGDTSDGAISDISDDDDKSSFSKSPTSTDSLQSRTGVPCLPSPQLNFPSYLQERDELMKIHQPLTKSESVITTDSKGDNSKTKPGTVAQDKCMEQPKKSKIWSMSSILS
ncbi:Hypothetical predicted protein [Mytilus galloprovincialis]|uniref:Homeobox domain-containing protein n=1 Tax=Mytilus galloprovincialis TaxID=29158 RepID=A0A8B6FH93_MYTGA|nr:Hypothetical predicted protein [Mytilus galloprovincialis]